MAILSKKKYNEYKTYLEEKMEERDVDEALAKLCEILKFDPVKGIYDKERGKKQYEKLKDIAEKTGQSIYVISGRKKYYDINKK